MFKKLSPEERVAECKKRIVKTLDKYKCVLDSSVTIANSKITQNINILPLKEENKAKA